MYLTDKEIMIEIDDYINDKTYAHAIMIDGQWGSGKTFFIQKLVIPRLESNALMMVLYISLYGINSREDLTTELYLKLLEKQFKDKHSVVPIITATARVFLKREGLDELPVEKAAEKFVKFDKCVIVFDDLERCPMPINDALGAINSLVEQHNFKAIIVANESEIGTINLHNNMELKYLVARDGQEKSNKDGKTDVDMLMRRVRELFQENELYKKVKEKVIGRTIVYMPDMRTVANSIIDTTKTCNYILTHKSNTISEILDAYSDGYNNIRTLLFSLAFCSRVINIVEENVDLKPHIDRIAQDVIKSTLRIAREYKDGRAPHAWDEGKEYGEITYGNVKVFSSYFLAFKFVQDYVYETKFSKEHIIVVLKQYITQLSKEEADPLRALDIYWMLEDDEVEEAIQSTVHRIYNMDYNPVDYPRILTIFGNIKACGFDVQIEEIYGFMKEDTRKRAATGVSMRQYGDGLFDVAPEIRDKYDELKILWESGMLDGHRHRLDQIINGGDGWGGKFSIYLSEHKGELVGEKVLMGHIDVEDLSEVLNRSKTGDYSDFRRALASFYNFQNVSEYLSGDKECLQKLHGLVRSGEYSSKTKELNRVKLAQQIQEIVERLV